jgi:hypothetical protein
VPDWKKHKMLFTIHTMLSTVQLGEALKREADIVAGASEDNISIQWSEHWNALFSKCSAKYKRLLN